MDADEEPEVTARTFTVLLYLTEGAHSTAFPDFRKEQLPPPHYAKDEQGSDVVENAAAMRAAVEAGLLQRNPAGEDLLHFKRWTAQLGDMAIFSQDVMHHGTIPVGACPQRLTLFSILTQYSGERQDASQIFRPVCVRSLSHAPALAFVFALTR